ncbi:hypothetical protein F5Y15DRAFT_372009 [Xylariaceae sp. FL0016]|nr:hypothetical protein F5Y15DRAFT_372009 [Xylariaceae sp. FL0016]
MPLPQEAFTISGGCNCGAVRYRIAVPAFDGRDTHPAYTGITDKADVKASTPRMPLLCTDHCNDCRDATSAVLPMWILTLPDMVTISCLPRDEVNPQDHGVPPVIPTDTAGFPARLPLWSRSRGKDQDRPAYEPAFELLSGQQPNHKTWLNFYASSYQPSSPVPKRRMRSFCGRCGTNIAYVPYPMPFGWPNTIDVIMGTADRADLEKEWMRPDYQLWWKFGVPWVQEMVKDLDARKAPTHVVTEALED